MHPMIGVAPARFQQQDLAPRIGQTPRHDTTRAPRADYDMIKLHLPLLPACLLGQRLARHPGRGKPAFATAPTLRRSAINNTAAA